MTRTRGLPHARRWVVAAVLSSLLLTPISIAANGSSSSSNVTQISFLFPLVPGISSALSEVLESMIIEFNSRNPDILVKSVYAGSYTDTAAKVTDLVEAGTPPDAAVLNVNAAAGLLERGGITSLTEYIDEAGGAEFLGGYHSSLFAYEPIYGFPIIRSTPLLYVNRDLLQGAGIDEPPSAWQDLLALEVVAEALVRNGTYPLAIPDTWTDWIYGAFARQAGTQLVENDWVTPTFDSEGNADALGLWVELTERNIIPSPLVPWSNSLDLFLQQKVAMLYFTSGGISKIRANAKFSWEAVYCPAGPFGYGVEEGGGDFHIFKDVPKENQDAAWRLIMFLTSPENSAKWSAATGYIAVAKAAYEMEEMQAVVRDTPAYGVARDQFEYANPQMMSINVDDVREVVKSNLNAALVGSKSVEKALSDGQAGMKRAIVGDLNQLGSIRIFGYVLFGLTTLLSLTFCIWTLFYRNTRVVMASQPFFLYMIIAGCLIFGAAIIPLSIDDGVASAETCTRSCRVLPWFLAIGFTIIFSALYSKIRRLNIVLRSAQSFQRVQVKEQDVLLPFGILFGINLVLLILWTVLDPLTWQRQPVPGSDGTSTYGICASSGSVWLPIFVLLIVANALALILANVEACRVSSLDIEFHESRYIQIATGLVLQAIFIGIPLLALTLANSTARYFVSCTLVFVITTAVLSFIFVPKITAKKNSGAASDGRSSGLRFSARSNAIQLKALLRKIQRLRNLMEERGVEDTEVLFQEAKLDDIGEFFDDDFKRTSQVDWMISRVSKRKARRSSADSLESNGKGAADDSQTRSKELSRGRNSRDSL